MIRAIETRFKGYRFRSRLEARWAVFFHALGLRWEYEPEGFDLGGAGAYLPDFWLPDFNGGIFVEVKPDDYEPSANDSRKWGTLAAEGRWVLLVSGVPSAKIYPLIYGFWDEDIAHHLEAVPMSCWAGLRVMETVFCTRYLPGGRRPHRLFYTFGERDAALYEPDAPRRAIEAARSARFEHGESPHG